MTEQNRQFDDLEGRVSDRFRRDLRTLWEPAGPVPAQAEQAILNQARHRLGRSRRVIIRLRWAAGAVAAAAVLVIGVVLYQAADHLNPQSAIRNPQFVDSRVAQQAISTRIRPDLAEGRADIDSNGRVDILDAFRLARHVESRGQTKTQWDLNDDGLVDRKDVDLVAFAAVRLDKGV